MFNYFFFLYETQTLRNKPARTQQTCSTNLWKEKGNTFRASHQAPGPIYWVKACSYRAITVAWSGWMGLVRPHASFMALVARVGKSSRFTRPPGSACRFLGMPTAVDRARTCA